MTDCSDSSGAPVDTADDLISAIDQVVGGGNSDGSQIASLEALHLESASNGGSSPHS